MAWPCAYVYKDVQNPAVSGNQLLHSLSNSTQYFSETMRFQIITALSAASAVAAVAIEPVASSSDAHVHSLSKRTRGYGDSCYNEFIDDSAPPHVYLTATCRTEKDGRQDNRVDINDWINNNDGVLYAGGSG